MLVKEIFDKEFNLFEFNFNKVACQPSVTSRFKPGYLFLFRMVGRITAKCLLE